MLMVIIDGILFFIGLLLYNNFVPGLNPYVAFIVILACVGAIHYAIYRRFG